MALSDQHMVKIGKAARLLLIDLGLDPLMILKSAGLPPNLLDEGVTKIPLLAYFKLWDALEDQLDDPMLSLKLGDASAIDYFDPAFFAAMCSPNMNIAATRLSEFKQLVGPFLLQVEINPKATKITFKCKHNHDMPLTMALTEIVFLVNFIRRATRSHITPNRVGMPFEVPEHPTYEAHFGCKIERSDQAFLILDAADAARPFLTHDDDMWSFFEPQLQRQMAEATAPPNIREKVERCLTELLPSGRTSIEDVAGELALSKRTLQRRLTDEGTTWQDVLNDTREKLAKHYLAKTELGTAEVSLLLGYEDPNSLFRAFKRWEENSPELWREQARAH